MKIFVKGSLAVVFAAIATAAFARPAEVTADLNMRAGAGTQYPVITTIPGGGTVEVYGCVRSFNWCDVSWRGARGWVSANYLAYYYDDRWRPLPEWGPRVDVPIITFSFGTYADRHYHDRPFYRRWRRDHDRDWDRRRHGYRRDWDGPRHGDRRDRDRGPGRGAGPPPASAGSPPQSAGRSAVPPGGFQAPTARGAPRDGSPPGPPPVQR